jgi:hypothetical protein
VSEREWALVAVALGLILLAALILALLAQTGSLH